jgi:hypothetical protein
MYGSCLPIWHSLHETVSPYLINYAKIYEKNTRHSCRTACTVGQTLRQPLVVDFYLAGHSLKKKYEIYAFAILIFSFRAYLSGFNEKSWLVELLRNFNPAAKAFLWSFDKVHIWRWSPPAAVKRAWYRWTSGTTARTSAGN